MTYDRATDLIRAGDDLLADSIVFKVIPHPLVGIQFRRIGRQEKQPKPLLDGVRFNEPGNTFRPVCRMPVNDQKHHPFGALKQPLDEVNKLRCAHTAFDGHETEFSLCADRRHNVHAETRPGGTHHGGLSFHRPCGARMMIRAYPGLIAKEYLRLQAARHAPNPGILFVKPSLDFFRLLLIRTPYRFLRGQPQLRQQTAHGCFTHRYAKLPVYQLPNHLRRPQRIRELHLQGILHRHCSINPLQSLSVQFRRSATALTSVQGAPPSMAVLRKPPVDCPSANSKHLRDNLGTSSILHTAYRALPQLRERLMIQPPCIVRSHAYKYTKPLQLSVC